MSDDWEDKKARMALLEEPYVKPLLDLLEKLHKDVYIHPLGSSSDCPKCQFLEAYRLAVSLRRLFAASVAGAEEAPASLNVYPRKGWEAPGIPEHDDMYSPTGCTCKGDFTCEGHRA